MMFPKKLQILVGLIAAITLTAAMASTSIARIGPFFTALSTWDSATALQTGGQINYYLAGDSVRIGQVVYLSAKNTVKTSTTLADYNAVEGVVIGGTRTTMQAKDAVTDTSTLAATAGQRVLVLKRGRAWVLDSGGGKAPGTAVRPSGTAGRLAARTTAIDTFTRVFGKTVDTTVSGKAVLVDVNVR